LSLRSLLDIFTSDDHISYKILAEISNTGWDKLHLNSSAGLSFAYTVYYQSSQEYISTPTASLRLLTNILDQHVLQKTYIVLLIAEFCCKTIFDVRQTLYIVTEAYSHKLHFVHCFFDKRMTLRLKLTGYTVLLLGLASGLWYTHLNE
jgi:hypothetical protein